VSALRAVAASDRGNTKGKVETQEQELVMTQVFVYYHDDYYDNGGVGLSEFDSDQAATDFILARMERVADEGGESKLENYTVIRGRKLAVVAAERVTSLLLKRLEDDTTD
jgi:hypothetical protein